VFEEFFSPDIPPTKHVPKCFLEAISGETAIRIVRTIGGDRVPLASIDKRSGCLASYSPSGQNVLRSPLLPNFSRAATDNDKGGLELALSLIFPWFIRHAYVNFLHGDKNMSYYCCWKQVGLDGAAPLQIVCDRARVTDSTDDNMIGVVALCSVFSPDGVLELFKVKLHYYIFTDGRIEISNHVVPQKALIRVPSLARVGMTTELDPSLYDIQYVGRGPSENYPDRKAGSVMGCFKTTPAEMGYTKYVVPSENGSRSDCRRLALRSRGSGDGFCIVTTYPHGGIADFSCSALLYSADELNTASHTCDLGKKKNGESPIYLNIDHALMGVGGDNRYALTMSIGLSLKLSVVYLTHLFVCGCLLAGSLLCTQNS
jgi:beta-galactosidase